ncbi:MAG: sulfite exporter TauE/SafE family protein [Clostridiaceae bacterium]
MNIITSTFSVVKPILENQNKFIEDKVSKLPGVLQCKINKDYKAYVVTYDSELCIEEDINRIIENPELNSSDKMEFSLVSFLFISMFFIILFLLNLKFKHINSFQTFLFVLVIFIGSLTPFYQIKYDDEFKEISEYINFLFSNTKISKSTLFHIGRVLGFTLIGLVFGYIGSLIKTSAFFFPIFQILASIYILALGLYICGIKVFKRVHRSLPFVTEHRIVSGNKFVIGLKSCLIPSITIQVMQIFAGATGSPQFGASVLFIFTLATIPNGISNHIITHTLGELRVAKASAASGILVLILGFFILFSGLGTYPVIKESTPNLNNFFNQNKEDESSLLSKVAVIQSDFQTAEITIENNHFSPTILYVKKNVPLQLNFKYLGNNNDKRNIYFSPLDLKYSFEEKTGSILLPPLENNVIFYNFTGSHAGKIIVSDNPILDSLNASKELSTFKVEQRRLTEFLKKDTPLEKVIKKAEPSPDEKTQTIVIENSLYNLSPYIIVAKPAIPLEMVFNLTNFNVEHSHMTIRKIGNPSTIKTLTKSANFFNETVTFNVPGTYVLLDQNTVVAMFHIDNNLRNIDLEAIKSKHLGPKSN